MVTGRTWNNKRFWWLVCVTGCLALRTLGRSYSPRNLISWCILSGFFLERLHKDSAFQHYLHHDESQGLSSTVKHPSAMGGQWNRLNHTWLNIVLSEAWLDLDTMKTLLLYFGRCELNLDVPALEIKWFTHGAGWQQVLGQWKVLQRAAALGLQAAQRDLGWGWRTGPSSGPPSCCPSSGALLGGQLQQAPVLSHTFSACTGECTQLKDKPTFCHFSVCQAEF